MTGQLLLVILSYDYGTSVTVCLPFGCAADSCQYMPIQCIYIQCAHAKLNVTISGSASEPVFVAIPIHLKYCV